MTDNIAGVAPAPKPPNGGTRCRTQGATGVSRHGTDMICDVAKDGHLRWQRQFPRKKGARRRAPQVNAVTLSAAVVAPAAPPPGTDFDPKALAEQLRQQTSAATAKDMLTGLNAAQLKQVAAAVGLADLHQNKEGLKTGIVYMTVIGPRTLRRAMGDEEETKKPYTPDPSATFERISQDALDKFREGAQQGDVDHVTDKELELAEALLRRTNSGFGNRDEIDLISTERGLRRNHPRSDALADRLNALPGTAQTFEVSNAAARDMLKDLKTDELKELANGIPTVSLRPGSGKGEMVDAIVAGTVGFRANADAMLGGRKWGAGGRLTDPATSAAQLPDEHGYRAGLLELPAADRRGRLASQMRAYGATPQEASDNTTARAEGVARGMGVDVDKVTKNSNGQVNYASLLNAMVAEVAAQEPIRLRDGTVTRRELDNHDGYLPLGTVPEPGPRGSKIWTRRGPGIYLGPDNSPDVGSTTTFWVELDDRSGGGGGMFRAGSVHTLADTGDGPSDDSGAWRGGHDEIKFPHDWRGR